MVGYELSAACGGEQTHANNWDSGSFQYLDYLNVMTYDAPSNVSTNHASLQFMKDAMDIYNNAGCPYSKMVGGAAFYSRPAIKMYSTILDASANKQNTFETDGTGSQLYNGKNTLEAKMEYVVDTKGGSGILIWEVTQDKKGQYSLLNVLFNKAQEYACPVPKPDLGADVSICGASSLVLHSNVTGSYNFNWKKNGNAISGSGRNKTITSAGTYKVTVSDGSCSWSDEIEVLGVLPNVDLGADLDLCNPSTVVLDATLTGSGLSYNWKKNNVIISGATLSNLVVTQVGIYKITVSVAGCASVTDQIVITSSLVEVNNETRCGTGTVTFTVSNSGGLNHKWYTALTGGVALATSNSYTTPSLSNTTNYYVKKYDPSGGICNGVGAWNATTVYKKNPVGSPQLTYDGKLYKRISWWTKGDIPDVSPTHWEETAVCGSNCERTKVKAIIKPCLGLEEIFDNSHTLIYPNPATKFINIQVGIEFKKIEIINITGVVVLRTSENSFGIEKLAQGMYFVKIYTEDGVQVKSFLKK